MLPPIETDGCRGGLLLLDDIAPSGFNSRLVGGAGAGWRRGREPNVVIDRP